MRKVTSPPAIAIVIVSWNVQAMLRDCLHSVFADLTRSDLDGEVWVVDNASADDSVAMVKQEFPQVNLVVSPINLGFAGGNNLALTTMGFKRGTTSTTLPETVLLLNPDTEVQSQALAHLYTFLKQTPQAGIAGAQLRNSDGSFQHGAFAFPGLWQLAIDLLPVPGRLIESPLNGRYSPTHYANNVPFPIGHPLGAAMCVRREAIEDVGLLDETYYMYVEEVDWSKRIAQAGWHAYCVPQAVVIHHSGQSSGQIKIESFINLWRSRYRFYRRYYSPLKVHLARLVVDIGMGRKAAQAYQAEAAGDITSTERQAWVRAYQTIINLWHHIET